MYNSLTKKFQMKTGEHMVNRHNLNKEIITAKQIEEAQEKPDTWILIGDNHVKDRR